MCQVASSAPFPLRPALEHWLAAKGVLRCLTATRTMGLTWGGNSGGSGSDPGSAGTMELRDRSDVDYAGGISTRRSTTAYVFRCSGAAIS